MQDRQDILRELERLYKTRSGRVLAGWYALNDAWRVLEGNARAIKEIEQRINASRSAMLEINASSDVRDRVLLQVSRFLHNFLASAVTLDDQTLGHVKRFYRNTPLETDLNRLRAQSFSMEPYCAVVHTLRNIALHFALPEILYRFRIEPSPGGTINDPGTTENLTLLLNREHAQTLVRAAGNRKNPLHKQTLDYFGTLASDIALAELVDRYIDAMQKLTSWLRSEEVRFEGTEMERFTAKHNELVGRYNAGLAT